MRFLGLVAAAALLTAGVARADGAPAPPAPTTPASPAPSTPAAPASPPAGAAGASAASAPDPEEAGADFVPGSPKPAVSPYAGSEVAVAGKHDIVIQTPGERTGRQIALAAGLAGGAALLGGIGLYFHLDSKSASDELSADRATNQAWSPALQDTYDRAHRSRVAAGVFYGVGGALVVASVVTLILTEPKTETTILHPRAAGGAPLPMVALGPDGAVLGGRWSF